MTCKGSLVQVQYRQPSFLTLSARDILRTPLQSLAIVRVGDFVRTEVWRAAEVSPKDSKSLALPLASQGNANCLRCILMRLPWGVATKRPVGVLNANGPRLQISRRQPTLPRSCPRSTMGAGELNYRVRNGNGCGLTAIATGKVWRFLCSARSPRRASSPESESATNTTA